ncbi:hypothetical protein [Catenovulum sediminis]|uniref:hypothetical protein n=1 Tax=Catenovulum sediminis TaxID=1740262 RepID=UPI00117FB875|nr:hypothetical protein [Catenovulum sediminis]
MSAEKDLTAAEQKAINDRANKLINLDKLGNIDEPMADIAKSTTAGAEKESTNSINKTGQAQRDKFDADFEVLQIARSQKESMRREHTVAERQRIDADFKAYEEQYKDYRQNSDLANSEWIQKNTLIPDLELDIAKYTPWVDLGMDTTRMDQGIDLESSILNDSSIDWMSVENSGFTFAVGSSISGDAGIGGAGAAGIFFNMDFSRQEVSFGRYWSAQGGATVGVPGVDAGIEFTLFNTSDWASTMEGMYNASGGQVAALFSGTVEAITTMPSLGQKSHTGIQLTLGLGTPTIEGHTQFGYGAPISPTTLKYREIPGYIWEKIWD